MKHKEPQFVTLWRDKIQDPTPQCCHTCDNYLDDGKCWEFDSLPPKEFAESIGVCDKWFEEIPF